MREHVQATDEGADERRAMLRQALVEDFQRFGIINAAGKSLDPDVTDEALDRGAAILQKREPPPSDMERASNKRWHMQRHRSE